MIINCFEFEKLLIEVAIQSTSPANGRRVCLKCRRESFAGGSPEMVAKWSLCNKFDGLMKFSASVSLFGLFVTEWPSVPGVGCMLYGHLYDQHFDSTLPNQSKSHCVHIVNYKRGTQNFWVRTQKLRNSKWDPPQTSVQNPPQNYKAHHRFSTWSDVSLSAGRSDTVLVKFTEWKALNVFKRDRCSRRWFLKLKNYN